MPETASLHEISDELGYDPPHDIDAERRYVGIEYWMRELWYIYDPNVPFEKARIPLDVAGSLRIAIEAYRQDFQAALVGVESES